MSEQVSPEEFLRAHFPRARICSLYFTIPRDALSGILAERKDATAKLFQQAGLKQDAQLLQAEETDHFEEMVMRVEATLGAASPAPVFKNLLIAVPTGHAEHSSYLAAIVEFYRVLQRAYEGQNGLPIRDLAWMTTPPREYVRDLLARIGRPSAKKSQDDLPSLKVISSRNGEIPALLLYTLGPMWQRREI